MKGIGIMMPKGIKKRIAGALKLNNKGSAIITTIVVAVFISIIATTMLYITNMNYQMKATDYNSTKSFYNAEEALDSLKAALVKDVSVACEKAYQTVLVEYAMLDGNSRKEDFNKVYVETLKKIWETRVTAAGGSWEDAIRTLLINEYGVDADVANCICADPEGVGDTIKIPLEEYNKGQFIISGVKSVYVEDGYSTYIETDFGLLLPEYDMSVDASSTWIGPDVEEREIVNMSEYVIYLNWNKY